MIARLGNGILVKCACNMPFECFSYLCLAMPTILIIKGYRLFFFSNEGSEPVHIHIEKAECYAKFWLDPLCVVINYGFTGKELREISDIVEKNELLIREKWDEHFST
jgi:hypothetical protein